MVLPRTSLVLRELIVAAGTVFSGDVAIWRLTKLVALRWTNLSEKDQRRGPRHTEFFNQGMVCHSRWATQFQWGLGSGMNHLEPHGTGQLRKSCAAESALMQLVPGSSGSSGLACSVTNFLREMSTAKSQLFVLACGMTVSCLRRRLYPHHSLRRQCKSSLREENVVSPTFGKHCVCGPCIHLTPFPKSNSGDLTFQGL